MKTHKAKPRKAIVRPRAVKGGDATAPSLERDADRIIEVIESGRSAFVWCKDGRRADDAIDAASKRLSSAGYKAIDMLLPVSYHPTYEGNFSSRVGKSLYSVSGMDEVALLNRLKKEKRRIVIFMTRLNFAVQGNAATPQMNSWTRFLVSLLECIPANKVFLIIGSSMSPAEMKERFTESEPLPFEDDQVIAIDYNELKGSKVEIDIKTGKVRFRIGESVEPQRRLSEERHFFLVLLFSVGFAGKDDGVLQKIACFKQDLGDGGPDWVDKVSLVETSVIGKNRRECLKLLQKQIGVVEGNPTKQKARLPDDKQWVFPQGSIHWCFGDDIREGSFPEFLKKIKSIDGNLYSALKELAD